MLGSRYLLAVVLILTAGRASASPAEVFCENFQNQPRRCKAERAITFYQSISTSPIAGPPYSVTCIAEHLNRVEPAALAYCAARTAGGHDALVSELDRFATEFQFLAFDCEHEESRPFFERLETPIYCRDIEQYLRDSIPLLARIKPP